MLKPKDLESSSSLHVSVRSVLCKKFNKFTFVSMSVTYAETVVIFSPANYAVFIHHVYKQIMYRAGFMVSIYFNMKENGETVIKS